MKNRRIQYTLTMERWLKSKIKKVKTFKEQRVFAQNFMTQFRKQLKKQGISRATFNSIYQKAKKLQRKG